ncbi:DMT family transporter [Vibrio cortegadensis]|uniref:DMT family transporter n=1 Tax=Vibrio cortegadensis TaxID=1328770 RepID=A0ABV4M4N0_9VIBR
MIIIPLTTLALIAFAANSVLSRLALGSELIDASSFTSIRLFSGAITLYALIKLYLPPRVHSQSCDSQNRQKGSWKAGILLFVYAVTFSFGYLSLDTATGALILFGSVQATMLINSLLSGNKVTRNEIWGMIIAFSGFLYLVLPNVDTPSLFGFGLMMVSGVAWGMYTINGRSSKQPLIDTGFNFIRTLPFAVILFLLSLHQAHYTLQGILLACASGSLASGVGYAIWYYVLPQLSVIRAASLQLLVPVLSAVGGVLFMSENITMHFVMSSALILGGIMIVLKAKE